MCGVELLVVGGVSGVDYQEIFREAKILYQGSKEGKMAVDRANGAG